MTDPTKPEKPDPASERWIYGGLRPLEGKKVHAWLPDHHG